MRRGDLSGRIEALIADARALVAPSIDMMTSEQRIRRIHQLELKAVPPDLVAGGDVQGIADFIARLHRHMAEQMRDPRAREAMLSHCEPSQDHARALLSLSAGRDPIEEQLATEARMAADRRAEMDPRP